MGLVLLASWYALSQIYGSFEAVSDAIDYQDDSGITEPASDTSLTIIQGYYWKGPLGNYNKCDGQTFEGKNGEIHDCTLESSVESIVSNALNSDMVSGDEY
jgi:hypothetical protein